MPSVAMTSNVKSLVTTFSGHDEALVLGAWEEAEPGEIRRLILRLSVGWRPPDLHPSGACPRAELRISSASRCRGVHHTGAASLPMHVGNLLVEG